MDPQQLTPALSIDDSPSLSDNESTFGIPAEQVDIIRGIVDKWHKKPLQIASDIVSALEGGDHTHIPLIVRNGEDQEVVVWAKCDTGACANFITMALVRKLKLEYSLQKIDEYEAAKNLEAPPRDHLGVGLIKSVCGFEGTEVSVNYILPLSFQATKFRTQHEKVEFEVLEIGDGLTSPASNQRTDLFLGASWLFKNEVFMLRKSYYVDPPKDLPVVETVPSQDSELTPIGRPPSSIYIPRGTPSIRLSASPAPPRLPRGRMG
ncbi:hypothetical protein E4T52_00220 [Aureobasidium sp. EXF-3400]|nr:hypothetical protein E4T51_01956 [Aureobasidium sp. EXF-12344]KAI4784814.1 hypothetical protein E4T52_00220 [Aureobasidium sp. EXF-3400]